MTPPSHHKTIAKHIATAWAVQPSVVVMSATGTPTRQAIAVASEWPASKLVSYSTIGLSDHCGCELSAVTLNRNKSVIKALFDVASYIADGNRKALPGEVFEKALACYYSRIEASHVLLSIVPPEGLAIPDLRIDRIVVKWLRVYSITSDELLFLKINGGGSLDSRLSTVPPLTVADLNRESLSGVPRCDPWK